MTTEYIAGVDPVQRLQRDVERAVPRAGAEVPQVQLLQHPGDEGALSRGPRRRHGRRGGSVRSVEVGSIHVSPPGTSWSRMQFIARCRSRDSRREGALAAARQERRDMTSNVQRITVLSYSLTVFAAVAQYWSKSIELHEPLPGHDRVPNTNRGFYTGI